jgi:hypothetical protein
MTDDELRDALTGFIAENSNTRLVTTFQELYGPTPDLLDVFVELYKAYDESLFSDYSSGEDVFNDMYVMYIGRKYKEFTNLLLAQNPRTMDVDAWKKRGRPFGILGLGDVDAYATGKFRPHSCNLINTTTSEVLAYYMRDISAQLRNVCVQPVLSILPVAGFGLAKLKGDVVMCDQMYSVFFINTVVVDQGELEGHSMLLVADHSKRMYNIVDINRFLLKTPYELDIAIEVFLDKTFGETWKENEEGYLCPRLDNSNYLMNYVFRGYCGPYSALTVLHSFCGMENPSKTQYELRIDLLNLKEAIFENAARYNPSGIVLAQIRECALLKTRGTKFVPCD